MSLDGKTHNSIDLILIDRRRYSNVTDGLFRAADCDTAHCLVVAKVRERLAVNNLNHKRFQVERYSLKKLN
jgi:hypothetical protein